MSCPAFWQPVFPQRPKGGCERGRSGRWLWSMGTCGGKLDMANKLISPIIGCGMWQGAAETIQLPLPPCAPVCAWLCVPHSSNIVPFAWQCWHLLIHFRGKQQTDRQREGQRQGQRGTRQASPLFATRCVHKRNDGTALYASLCCIKAVASCQRLPSWRQIYFSRCHQRTLNRL